MSWRSIRDGRQRPRKAIDGRHDRFLRLRSGDHRLPYEVDDARRAVLIEGIVPRKVLDKWLRSKR
jgi:mRNA-degrading endonuclease RelE of RelBE toxin-antitoxin system